MLEYHVAGCHWIAAATRQGVGPTCHVIANVAAMSSSGTHFLMWQLTLKKKRLSNVLVEVGPFITLASLSKVLAFAIGSFIPMPACQGNKDYDTEDYEDYVEAQDDV
ncbi:coatomer subunit gamma [Tanacetum coccineum]|uniref:Coatomer subunit gamma n=1 Tax=Tanacetum coccineum TaxID=301880 RepID=A0ABQ5AGF1_9ASTR